MQVIEDTRDIFLPLKKYLRLVSLTGSVKLTGQYGKFFNTKLVTYESLRALLVKCWDELSTRIDWARTAYKGTFRPVTLSFMSCRPESLGGAR